MSPALANEGEEGVTVVTAPPESGADFDRERTRHVIERETLEAEQPLDGVAAASLVPGVSLQRTNRGAGTPLIRGFAGPQNLVFVDDVRFDLSTFRTGPNQYAALADPSGLESVSVTLGPGAVLWGTGAMGGVLRYQTLDLPTETGVHGRAIARVGTGDQSGGATLQLSGRQGAFSGWIGGTFNHHGALRTGGGGVVPLSDYDTGYWRAKVGASLGGDWELVSAYLATRVADAARTDKLAKGEVRLYDNDDHLAYVQVRRRVSSGWLRDLKVTASYHHLDDRVSRFNCDRTTEGGTADLSACVARDSATINRTRDNHDTVDALGLRATAQMRWLDERLVLRSGLEGRVEIVGSEGWDSKSGGSVRGTFSDGSTYAGADVFAQLEGRPVLDPGVFELVLTGGARLASIFASADEVPGLGTVDYTHVSPAFSAGVRAILYNRLNVFASFHEGGRAPNLQETTALGDTGNFFEVPNDALGPERADSIEAGVRAQLGWLNAEAVYFHTWMTDAIVREEVTDGATLYPEAGDATVMQRINAEMAEIDGVEVGISTGSIAGFSAFADLAWLQSEVTRPDGSVEPGRRVAPLQGRAGLRFSGGKAGASVMAQTRWAMAQTELSSGDRKDLRICADPDRPWASLGDACEGTPGWATVDLQAGISPRPGMRIEASILNLLDVDYRHHGSGYDAPGIDVRLSLSYAL